MNGIKWALVLCLAACSAPTQDAQQRSSSGAQSAAGSAPVAVAGSSASGATDVTATANPGSPVIAAPEPPAMDGVETAEDDCGRQRFDVRRKPVEVLLVLDRSASMQDEPSNEDDDEDDDDENAVEVPSKWEVVVPALKEAIAATDGALSWGLKLFPLGDEAGECSEDSYPGSIAVPIAPLNAAKVNQAIEDTDPNGDGTPTGDAINEAVKYLQGTGSDNPKYILLATDGDPSCAGTEKGGDEARPAALKAVEAAANGGFDTFVVGISTTKESSTETLTELAAAGKRAPASGYYLANTQDELLAALHAITAAAASCRFPLSSRPPNPDFVGVLIGSDRVSKDTGHKDGWDYVDPEHSAIELYGPACDKVQATGADTVNIIFACKADELF
jgi:Mg-chelatase subunit ChlD